MANTLADNAKELYKKIPFASTTQTINLLHQFENIYIQAVINDDRDAIKYSLKGIIKCKKILNQDTTTFEKEYKHYHFKENKILPKVQQEKITPLNDIKVTKKDKPILKRSSNIAFLKDVKYKNQDLVFIFSKPLKYKDVLFFKLNFNKKYKDIYDIKANLPKDFKNSLKLDFFSRFAISQNEKDKIRVVLEDKKPIFSNAYIKNNQLIIHLKTKKVASNNKKATQKDKNQKYKIIKKYSKSIVIDPGHGGRDSGAIGYNKLEEKKAVLSIALKLKDELIKRGYRVYMTRSSDRFIDLKDRTHYANLKKADLFISIHANAIDGYKKYSIKGIETFYLSPARSERAKRAAEKENKASLINLDAISKNTLLNFLNRYKINQSRKLAIDVQSNVLKDLRSKFDGVKDGAVRPAPFWVLVGAGMPAVLIEVGYITNPTEAKRLFNPFYQKLLAKGIADGIESYFYKN